MKTIVIGLVLALFAPVGSGDIDCTDVTIVGIRGSGQTGYGEPVRSVVDAIADSVQAEGWSVEAETLDYPAISVSDSLGLVLITGEYERSVQAGAMALSSRIASLSEDCPATEFVLVGYSQGAQVIKWAFAGTAPQYGIGSVVLLADPNRDPAQLGVVRLGDPSATEEGSFGAVPFPDHLRVVAIDHCAVGDRVCERGRESFSAHIEGYADAPAQVTPFVIADLRGARPRAWMHDGRVLNRPR